MKLENVSVLLAFMGSDTVWLKVRYFLYSKQVENASLFESTVQSFITLSIL